MKHHFCLALLLAGSTLLTSACRPPAAGTSNTNGADQPAATTNEAKPAPTPAAATDGDKAKKRIGVSLLTVQHSFYQELRAGLQAEADKHGYELRIVSGEFSATRQANQVDEFIVQKVDAIVLSPCDSKSVGASIVAANEAKIPVFTADIANRSGSGDVVAHIASDNKEGGRKAAELLAKALSEKGEVVILSHPEVASVTDRVAGFKEKLATYPNMKVVQELSAEGRRDKAVKVMEDLLQSHPDVAGVFGINDDSALGALAAIESAGKGGKIAIVGYDATEEARAKIASGAIYGDVIQNPTLIGELTIRAIHDHFSGKAPAAVIPVDVGVYTK